MGTGERETASNDGADVAVTRGSGFLSLLKKPDYLRKVLHTVSIGWAFVMLGFIVGQRGPSFLDLQIITNTDLKRGSAFFTAGSVGYLLGSMLMGVLYDRFAKPLMMFLSVLFMGVTVGIIPFCSPYVLMIALCFLNSVGLGAVDTGGNADLVRVWGDEGRQYMQAIHFCFSLGGTISPIITEPFLAPIDDHDGQTGNITADIIQTWDTTGSSSNASTFTTTSDVISTYFDELANNSNLYNIRDAEMAAKTNISIAYMIGAILTVSASLPFLVIFFKDRTRTKKREPGPEEEKTRLSKPLFALTLTLVCLFFMFYCATEDTFAAFLLSFTVKGLNWSKSHGSQVTAAFWAAFAAFRFCGIFFINFLAPVKLLFICCTGMVLSLLAFLVCAHFQFFLGIWISSVSVGLSMSVIFPAAFTWVQDKLFHVTGKVSAAILAASSAGTMINPIILGFLMQQYTPMWYSYLLCTDSIACMGTFLVLLVLSRTCVKRQLHVTTIDYSKSKDLGGQTNCLQTMETNLSIKPDIS